MAAGGNLSDV